MFSGFDNFAEGFKRFSLDSLQQQEEEEGDNNNSSSTSTSNNKPRHGGTNVAPALTPVPEQPVEFPPTTDPRNEEDDGWEWGQEDFELGGVAALAREGASEGADESHLDGTQLVASSSEARNTAGSAVVYVDNAQVAQASDGGDQSLCNRGTSELHGVFGEPKADLEIVVDKVSEVEVNERREAFGQFDGIAEATRTQNGNSATGALEQNVSHSTVRLPMMDRKCSVSIVDVPVYCHVVLTWCSAVLYVNRLYSAKFTPQPRGTRIVVSYHVTHVMDAYIREWSQLS